MTSGIMVTTKHMRKANMCIDDSKAWFAFRGLSWREFILRGLPVEVVEATGDKTALEVCKIARAEHDGR